MKLHQVLFAILMFKSLDWIVVWLMDPYQPDMGDVIVAVTLWACFWILAWVGTDTIRRWLRDSRDVR